MQEGESAQEAKLTIKETTKWLASHEDDVLERYAEFLQEHVRDMRVDHLGEVLLQGRFESVFVSFQCLYAKIFIKLLLAGLTMSTIPPRARQRLSLRQSHN